MDKRERSNSNTQGDSVQDLVAKHKAKAVQKNLEKTKKSDLEEVKENPDIVVEEEVNIMSNLTFEELGVCSEVCEAIKAMGYKQPTKI